MALRLGVSTPASLKGSRALLPQRHALTSNREEPLDDGVDNHWWARGGVELYRSQQLHDPLGGYIKPLDR